MPSKGTMLTPLLGTASKFNFSQGRAIRFPWRSSASPSPSITSPCHPCSLPSPAINSSSPLIRKNLHPITTTLSSQLSSTSPCTNSGGLCSMVTIARECPPEFGHSARTSRSDTEGWSDDVLGNRQPDLALHSATPTLIRGATFLASGKKVERMTIDGYREAVSSDSLTHDKTHSFCAPMLCENSVTREMQSNGQWDDSNTSNSSPDTNNVCTVHSLPKSEVVRHERRNRHCDNPHYSATLGINTMDLPRRMLRDCKPSFAPLGMTLEGRGCRRAIQQEDEEDVGGITPCSPASLSASLGITSLKASSRPSDSTRLRNRNRAQQRHRPLRAHRKENWRPSDICSHYSSFKSCDLDVKAHAFDMKSCDPDQSLSSPLPLLLKIVEKNVSNKTSLTDIASSQSVGDKTRDVSSDPVKLLANSSNNPASTSNSAAGGVASSGVVEDKGEAVCGVQGRHSQRLKSPWRRSSVRSVFNYTPVKNGDKLSRCV